MPTSADTETNHNDSKTQKKYTVNHTQSGCVISRLLCCLLMAGVLLLLIGAVLATYFLIPSCPHAASVSSAMAPANQEVMVSDTKGHLYRLPSSESERLPTKLLPVHYRWCWILILADDRFDHNLGLLIKLAPVTCDSDCKFTGKMHWTRQLLRRVLTGDLWSLLLCNRIWIFVWALWSQKIFDLRSTSLDTFLFLTN